MSDTNKLLARLLDHYDTTPSSLRIDAAAAIRELRAERECLILDYQGAFARAEAAEAERAKLLDANNLFDKRYRALDIKLFEAEAERDRLRKRVNSLVGLCKAYSGALLDSDHPPQERDKLDAKIGDIEPS